jgi:hypothetical protein
MLEKNKLFRFEKTIGLLILEGIWVFLWRFFSPASRFFNLIYFSGFIFLIYKIILGGEVKND